MANYRFKTAEIEAMKKNILTHIEREAETKTAWRLRCAIEGQQYLTNPIGFYSGKPNVPKFGGTPAKTRNEIAQRVSAENPEELSIEANGIGLKLNRYNSATGKTWRWEAPITAEQYTAIVGETAPVWSHKGAVNTYSIIISSDCTVEVWAASGKKGFYRVLGEEFVTII